MHEQRIKTIILVIGDIMGMVVAWLLNHDQVAAILWIVFGGILGGFCTMAGRALYEWLSQQVKSKVKSDVEKN